MLLSLAALVTTALPAQAVDTGDGLCGRRALVVIGAPGLRWDTLPPFSELTTKYPRFTQALNLGASANLVDRTVYYRSCPADAWATLSAGRRTAISPQAATTSHDCKPLPTPESNGKIPGFSDLAKNARRAHPDSTLGGLGKALAETKIRTAAVGPGAALALADTEGNPIGSYSQPASTPAELGKQVKKLTDDHELVMVDLGPENGGDDLANTAAALPKIEAIMEAAPNNANVLIAGISDGQTAARLQFFNAGSGVTRDPCGTQLQPAQPTLARTPSTRVDGLVQLSDITANIIQFFTAAHIDGLQGQAISPGKAILASKATEYAVAEKAVDTLSDRARHAAASRTARTPYAVTLTVLTVIFTLSIPYFLARKKPLPESSDSIPSPVRRRLMATSTFGLFVAGFAASGFLLNAFPWWRPGPSVTEASHLYFGVFAVLFSAVLAGVMTLVSLLAARFSGRAWVAPTVLAVITFIPLTLDPIFHFGLATDSPIALSTVFGARFYGVGNTHFAIWISAALFLTALASTVSLKRYRRSDAVAVIIGMAVLLIAVDGIPGWGTDLGGPPALIIGFAVLFLLVLGIKLTWKRLATTVVVALLLAFAAIIADWLRGPAKWSHLGRFFQQILDGEAGAVITGKLSSIVLSDGWNLPEVAGLLLLMTFFFSVALAPLWYSRHKQDLYGWLNPTGVWRYRELDASVFPLVASWWTTMLVAMLINDSLMLIPIIGYTFMGPLLVAFMMLLLRQRWETQARTDV